MRTSEAMTTDTHHSLGGRELRSRDGCSFRVWAPAHAAMQLHVVDPIDRLFDMEREEDGYHSLTVKGLTPGARYLFRLPNGNERPDPASQSQPDGVHGASEVIRTDFKWHDEEWRGLPLPESIFYELHVGTFTPEGTFDAVIPHLDELRELGINAIELMPVSQFPGSRNWGYDGVYPGAAQNSYGGPDGLRRLVDACHSRGLAVVLDVVYNHLGPEGNYLGEFAPYFTGRYKTPWGLALNFDGPQSDHVRRFFIDNALDWLDQFHIDALRLDAVHAIVDHTARPFLEELADAVRELSTSKGKAKYTIAESDLNDPRLIRPVERGGYGLDTQWCDDFHHILHVLLTGERRGYYAGYETIEQLGKILKNGYLFTGQYSSYRQRRFGASARDLPGWKFVVCSQNHDQVGNRMTGDRLAATLPFAALKLTAGMTLLSPFLPLLFMGEEYGETAPFQYFTSHSDEALVEAVRKGRTREFAAFTWDGEVPDPQAETTFQSSRLKRTSAVTPERNALRAVYRELIGLRKTLPALRDFNLAGVEVVTFESERVLMMRRQSQHDEVLLLASFSPDPVLFQAGIASSWQRRFDSESSQWLGTGSTLPETLKPGELQTKLAPWHLVVYEKAQ
ncbi:MAG TPA: malto-oligosyltrehalose trehalohydrolase [Thermoanaerobaculia bacterium]|nr:malto-oligosyltrehalose trehalohydrolase [Thermoanaerobaculia bacterium]